MHPDDEGKRIDKALAKFEGLAKVFVDIIWVSRTVGARKGMATFLVFIITLATFYQGYRQEAHYREMFVGVLIITLGMYILQSGFVQIDKRSEG